MHNRRKFKHQQFVGEQTPVLYRWLYSRALRASDI
jgi:hypothetical protein